MKPRLALALLLSTAAAAPAARAQQHPLPTGFRQEFLLQFDNSMGKFIALAREMPADRYSWRPAEGVLPVAQVYSHVARYNYLYPAQNMGIAAPAGVGVDTLERVATKEEVIALLTASRDHVRRVVVEMPEAQLSASTELYGRNVQQWSVLLQLLAHMNEHLGQSIAYARMNGVVPPWSR